MTDSASHIYGPAVWVGHVYEELSESGCDAAALLRTAGLPKTALTNPDNNVNFSSFAKYFELAAVAAQDDLFGIRFGDKVDPRNMGILWYLGVSSTRLEKAIRNIARYSRITANYGRFLLQDESYSDANPGTYLLIFATLPFPSEEVRQVEEAAVSLYLNAFRLWTNSSLRPVEVTFKHHRSSGIAEIQKILGCNVTYGADCLSIRFKTTQMKLPIPTSDDRLLAILRRHGDELLKEIQPYSSTLEQDVTGLIVNLLAKGQAQSKIIASDLGLTERTLSRRLAGAGTSFSEVLTNVRHQLFLKYIRQKDLTLGHIAHLLGYSEPSALNNAVKRWTGKTPMEMRNST